MKQLETKRSQDEAEIRSLKAEKSILAKELSRALEEKEAAREESREAREESDVMRNDAVMLERLVRKLKTKLERQERNNGGGRTVDVLRDGYERDVNSVGDDGGSTFDSLSDRSPSPMNSLTSHARVNRATHL